MRVWLSAIVAVLALVSAGLGAGSPASTPTSTQAHAAWARVLARFVNDRGEVDFEALSRDRTDLDLYLRFVAEQPLDAPPDANERLAHMINAYNALSMFNVIDRGIPKSHAGVNKIINFIVRRLDIGGRRMSLYTFENEVIRPLARRQGEPRVHFALNCSAVSCPVLPRVPFTGAGLNNELEREARAFFAVPGNFRVDPVTGIVWLSELLKFYPEDFVPAHGRNLIEFANRYAARPAPVDAEIRFTPYDWTIANSRRAR